MPNYPYGLTALGISDDLMDSCCMVHCQPREVSLSSISPPFWISLFSLPNIGGKFFDFTDLEGMDTKATSVD